MGSHRACFLVITDLKIKFRVFLAGHTVAMVTFYATKLTETCSLMIGQIFCYHDFGIN